MYSTGNLTSGSNRTLQLPILAQHSDVLARQNEPRSAHKQPVSAELRSDVTDTGVRRHLLAVATIDTQTAVQTSDQLNDDSSPASSDVTASLTTDGALNTQPVRDDTAIKDAAGQQAMQHGSGALESGSAADTPPGRELHRQLGQRFNASQIRTGSETAQSLDGKASADGPIVQAEITPGKQQNYLANYLAPVWLFHLKTEAVDDCLK